MLIHVRIGFECELYRLEEMGAVYCHLEALWSMAYRAAQRLAVATVLTREAPELRAMTADTLAVRDGGSWVSPLSLEIAGGEAALARFADPSAGLAELARASLGGSPLLAEQQKILQEAPCSSVAPEGEGGMTLASAIAVTAASTGEIQLASHSEVPVPLSDSEKAEIAKLAEIATAPLHQRLLAAITASRDTPSWPVQLLEAQIHATRGCLRLLAVCQLAGLWRGLPDDADSSAKSEKSSSVLPKARDELAASAVDAVLPEFSFSRFIPPRPSSILYKHRYRDFASFMHPAPPSWETYVGTWVRQPLAGAPSSLITLLDAAGACFADAHAAAANLSEQLNAATRVGPDGALPTVTVKIPAQSASTAGDGVVGSKTSKRSGSHVDTQTRTACVVGNSADVLNAPSLLATATRLSKAAQANRVAALAIRKDSRILAALEYYAEAVQSNQLVRSLDSDKRAPQGLEGGHMLPASASVLDASISVTPLVPFGSQVDVTGGVAVEPCIRLDYSFHPLIGVVKLPSVMKSK